MKILVVSPWYKPHVGGVVMTVIKLIDGLEAAGAEVSLLTGGDSRQVMPQGSDGNTRLFSCRMRSPQSDRLHIRGFVAWFVMFLPTLFSLRKFIKQQQIEIVNIHFPGAEYVYFALLKLMLPVKLIVSIHGSDMRKQFHEHNLNRMLIRYLLRQADILLACSDDLKKYALGLIGGKPLGRTEVVYGGVDSDWLAAPESEAPGTVEPYLLAVGTLFPVKGFDILIRAYAQLGERGSKVRLRIVGDGPLREELTLLAEELGVSDRVVFDGAISHDAVKAFYQGATFCVMSSHNEGFPLVALEAQAAGRPVVASQVGGLPELIDDGVNGLLYPVGDVPALSQAMTRLLEDPALCQEMGRAGHRRVADNFTWDQTRRRYLEIFSSLLGQKS